MSEARASWDGRFSHLRSRNAEGRSLMMWLLELSVRYSRVHDHLVQEVDDPPEGRVVYNPGFQAGGRKPAAS